MYHEMLVTHLFLIQMKKIDIDLSTFCAKENESIEHDLFLKIVQSWFGEFFSKYC